MGNQFIEIEFPRTISAKAVGGPSFNTTVNPGQSGYEARNQNWQIPRGEWTVTIETPSAAHVDPLIYIEQLTAFFYNAGGKANAFRLKDHKDFTNGSLAQTIGAADGVTGSFQLVKNYKVGNLNFQRLIIKPITSQVLDYLNNALPDTVALVDGNGNTFPKNPGYIGGGSSKYSLDETTGIACFGSATKMAITNTDSLNGFVRYFFTLSHGALPQRGQQVIVHGDAVSNNNGVFAVTQVVTTDATHGWFTTTNLGVGGAGTAIAQIGWSYVTISQATSVGGGQTQYAYTLIAGTAPVAGQRFNVFDMDNGGNNGSFFIVSTGVGTVNVTNPSGVDETSSVGTGSTDWVPGSGAGFLTATYQYHNPVRFDTDDLQIQLEESNVLGGKPVITWNAITLREVRILPGQSNG